MRGGELRQWPEVKEMRKLRKTSTTMMIPVCHDCHA